MNVFSRRRHSGWTAVALLVLLATQPLAAGLPKGHDILLHYYRLPAIQSLWQEGVFYSRWLPDVTLGYGSPLFNFYPPLTSYLATGLYLLTGQNAPLAFLLLFGLCLAAAAVGMYLLARELYGVAGGVVAAAAYTLAPHLLYQTFARGSTANALAMGLYPWAVWLLIRLARRPSPRRLVVTALAIAAIFLSHTVASVIFLGPLAVIALMLPLMVASDDASATPGRPSLPFYLWPAILLGVALAAFAWLPALAEFQHTQYDIFAGAVDYRAHFARLWTWSGPIIAGLNNAPLPKTPGIVTFLLGVAGGSVSVVRLLRWRGRGRRSPEWLTAVIALVAITALFLSTAPSQFAWELIAPLRRLQFPWRLLDVAVFGLALVSGRLPGVLDRHGRWQNGFIALALLFLTGTALPSLYPPRLTAVPRSPTLSDATVAQQQYGIYGLTAWGEYTSAAVTDQPATPPFPGADAGATLADKVDMLAFPPDALTVLSTTPLRASFHVTLARPQSLSLAHHYFPGWQATIDGQRVAMTANAAGLLSVPLPAGDYELTIFFGRTPVRWLADGLSLLAVLTLLLLVARRGPVIGEGGEPTRTAARPLAPIIPLTLLALFLVKAVWLDQSDNPLVVHPTAEAIPSLPQPAWGNFGDRMQLLAYDIDAPDGLTLYWRARDSLSRVFSISVTLADARGVPVKTIVKRLPGRNVTSTWNDGDVVRDVYMLPVDLVDPPIGYRLLVSVLPPDLVRPLPLLDSPDGDVTELFLGTLKRPPPAVTPPAGATAIGTLFGGSIELSDAAVPESVQSGQTLPVTLYWRSLATVSENYTVFLHLVAADGAFVAGNDGQPRDGRYPTLYWAPGETIVDPHPWVMDVPPGTYTLQTGLYLLESGARLPASGPAATPLDSVILGTIRVTE